MQEWYAVNVGRFVTASSFLLPGHESRTTDEGCNGANSTTIVSHGSTCAPRLGISFSRKMNVPPAGDADREEPSIWDRILDMSPHCICRKYDAGEFMIYCTKCNERFHGECVGLRERDVPNLLDFVCPACTEAGKGLWVVLIF